MEDMRCFIADCMLDIEYACPCSSPQTYFCKLHVTTHLEVRNKTHTINSIFFEPHEEAREAILKFLAKLDSKHQKLRKEFLASYSQNFIDTKSDLKTVLKEMDSYSADLSNYFTKITQVKKIWKAEQDPVLGLLSLGPDEAVEKIKQIIPLNPEWYNNANVFCKFNEKMEKMIVSFIENKFQNYLDSRFTKIENTLKMHNKSISLTNNEWTNVKNSISNIINENNKSWKGFGEWKDTINLRIENEVNLLNSQINSIKEIQLKIVNEINLLNSRVNSINEIKLKIENEVNLLNFRITSITEDLKGKFKEPQIAQIQNPINNPFIQNLREERSGNLNIFDDLLFEEESKRAGSVSQDNYSIHEMSAIQTNQDYANTSNQQTNQGYVNTSSQNYANNYSKQIYQGCVNNYAPKKSVFNLINQNDPRNKKPSKIKRNTINCLLIYNTETETREAQRILNIPDTLGEGTCITQLPNGKLFCYGRCIVLIINENGEVIARNDTGEVSVWSSAIYFNGNVFCFGGLSRKYLRISSRFDLQTNTWTKLTPPPVHDLACSSVIINGDILIAGFRDPNLFVYSIRENAFTTISCQFVQDSQKLILIGEERFYLIECKGGSIYESECRSYAIWRQISSSSSSIDNSCFQVCFQYHKDGVYIGSFNERNGYRCFKFNLDQKCLEKLF